MKLSNTSQTTENSSVAHQQSLIFLVVTISAALLPLLIWVAFLAAW